MEARPSWRRYELMYTVGGNLTMVADCVRERKCTFLPMILTGCLLQLIFLFSFGWLVLVRKTPGIRSLVYRSLPSIDTVKWVHTLSNCPARAKLTALSSYNLSSGGWSFVINIWKELMYRCCIMLISITFLEDALMAWSRFNIYKWSLQKSAWIW